MTAAVRTAPLPPPPQADSAETSKTGASHLAWRRKRNEIASIM